MGLFLNGSTARGIPRPLGAHDPRLPHADPLGLGEDMGLQRGDGKSLPEPASWEGWTSGTRFGGGASSPTQGPDLSATGGSVALH